MLYRAAKDNGYKKEASKISPKDHAHKATVAQFAQMLSAQAEDHKFGISTHPSIQRLFFRAFPNGQEQPVHGTLSLTVLRFRENQEDPSGSAVEEVFMSMFEDEPAMVAFIQKRANFRNEALYAQDGGAPSMDRDKLDIQLHDLSRCAVGLIWAAVDLSYHETREPTVLQLLNAAASVANKVKKLKLCELCDGPIGRLADWPIGQDDGQCQSSSHSQR